VRMWREHAHPMPTDCASKRDELDVAAFETTLQLVRCRQIDRARDIACLRDAEVFRDTVVHR